MSTNHGNYTPQPNIVVPGVATTPFGAANVNSEGSTYAATYSKLSTDLVSKYIERQIFDVTNKQYAAFYTFMYNKAMQEVPSTEFHYKESVWGREAATVNAWVNGTQTITLAGTYTLATDVPFTVNDVIILPQVNRPAIVSSIAWTNGLNGTDIVVRCQTGSGVFGAGEVVAGDVLSLQSAIIGDGMDRFFHFERADTLDRYNYIQLFQRNSRWGQVELLEMQNNATTDYLNYDKNQKLEQLRVDLFSTWLNGTRGEATLTMAGGTYLPAKMMGGVVPTMIAAGCPSTSVTIAGLPAAFETYAFATNWLSKGKTRMILGTDESLYEISKQLKNPIQYTPNDKVASLNINKWEMGTMEFVPLACPLMGDSTILPEEFANKVIVLDMDTMTPVKLKGLPHIEMGQTKDLQEGSRETFKDWWVKANFSMKYNNPAAGFIINIL